MPARADGPHPAAPPGGAPPPVDYDAVARALAGGLARLWRAQRAGPVAGGDPQAGTDPRAVARAEDEAGRGGRRRPRAGPPPRDLTARTRRGTQQQHTSAGLDGSPAARRSRERNDGCRFAQNPASTQGDARTPPVGPLPDAVRRLHGHPPPPRPGDLVPAPARLTRHRERVAKDGPCWSPALPPSLPSPLCCRSPPGPAPRGGVQPERRTGAPARLLRVLVRLLLAMRDALREDARGGPVRRGRAR